METETQKSKAGFVAVLGHPNVGKSTLINRLLGHKIAAVSSKPQTTRKRQMGILTTQRDDINVQIVFVDTPGIHEPRYKLGEMMNKEASETLRDSDVLLFVVDASSRPTLEDKIIIQLINKTHRFAPLVLAINKIDLIDQQTLEQRRQEYMSLIHTQEVMEISATRGDGLDELLSSLIKFLPESEAYFPEDQLTDLYERDIAADFIREAGLELLRDEVPHGIAVRIDQYKERNEHGAYIEATLFLEKESHKPIVIGKGGSMLKMIGSLARKKIESMSGRKIYLQLRVKVRKNWRNNPKVLQHFDF